MTNVQRAPLTARVRGWKLHSLSIGSVGDNGLIPHTLKHFMRSEEGWGGLPPKAALAPEEVRSEFEREHGYEETEFCDPRRGERIDRSQRWWSGRARELVLRAHDEGYWPRQKLLVEWSGTPGEPGSQWELSGRDWKARQRGYTIAVQTRAARTSQFSSMFIKTAFANAVIREGELVPKAGISTLGEALSDDFEALRAALVHCSPKPKGEQ